MTASDADLLSMMRTLMQRFDQVDALLTAIAIDLSKVDVLLDRIKEIEADLVALRKEMEDRP